MGANFKGGRKKSTSAPDERRMKQILMRDRFKSAAEIHFEVQSTSRNTFSSRTVQRRLLEEGFKSCRAAKKPLLTQAMKSAQLKWAQNKKSWTTEDWRGVVFSDESNFLLIGNDTTRRVRREPGERYRPNCILRRVKHSPYVMIWGCMTGYGVGALNFV